MSPVPLDDLPLLDALGVTHHHDADLADVEVQGDAQHAVLELQQLVGHGRRQTLDPGDAVAGGDDGADLLAGGGLGLVVLDEPVQRVPDLLRTNSEFCHAVLIRSSLTQWCVSSGMLVSCVVRRRAWRLGQAAGHGALDDLVAELDPDPAEQVGVDDVLKGDVAADLLRADPHGALPLVVGQRPGHPHGGDDPVLLSGRQSDVALDGVTEVRSRAATARLASTIVARWPGPPAARRPGPRGATGPPPVTEGVAQPGVGLHQPSEPEQLVLGLVEVAARVGVHQLGPHGLSLEGCGEGPPTGPAHARASATMSTASSETLPSSSPWTKPRRAVLRRTRVGDAPVAAPPSRPARRPPRTGRRTAAQVGRRRARAPRPRSGPGRRCGASARAMPRRARRPARSGGLRSHAHERSAVSAGSSDSRSARNRSTVRRARSSSSSDSPTIRPARVVARPPISLRSWVIT